MNLVIRNLKMFEAGQLCEVYKPLIGNPTIVEQKHGQLTKTGEVACMLSMLDHIREFASFGSS